MLSFLPVAGLLALGVVLVLVLPLVRPGRQAPGRDQLDAQVFRDQLAEIDRDLSRGLISSTEAEGARVEVSRRLLGASARARQAEGPAPAPRRRSYRIAAVTMLIVIASTVYVYFGTAAALRAVGIDDAALRKGLTLDLAGRKIAFGRALAFEGVGNPGRADRPLAARSPLESALAARNWPTQQAAEEAAAKNRPPPAKNARQDALFGRMRTLLAKRPDDVRGHRIFARALAQAGHWVESRKVYDRVVELSGVATDAETYADYAEVMVFATGGYVSPKAVRVLDAALALDRSQAKARFYAAFAIRQTGQGLAAVRIWEALLREDRAAASPVGKEWQETLARLIIDTRRGPPKTAKPARGPTAADVRAAEKLSARERAERIEAMVKGLDERLASEGGSAEEWVRLIRSYVQLGRKADALRALQRAQGNLTEKTARSFVREQALLLGVKAE